jgi:hypothetical protein
MEVLVLMATSNARYLGTAAAFDVAAVANSYATHNTYISMGLFLGALVLIVKNGIKEMKGV